MNKKILYDDIECEVLHKMMKSCLENLDENPCWENLFASSKTFCVGQHAGFSCRSMIIVHYLYLHKTAMNSVFVCCFGHSNMSVPNSICLCSQCINVYLDL